MTSVPRPDLGAELEEAHRGLARERHRYFELFDLAPIGYAITNRDGLIREINRTGAELLGMSATRLIGKPVAAFVPTRERREFRDQLVELSLQPGRRSWETTLVGRDGRSHRVELTVSPALAESRELDDFRWAIVDITERLEAEAAIRRFAAELEERVHERTAELAQQRARLEAVVENMPAGLIIVDNDSRVLTANDRAREILGLEQVETAIPSLGWDAHALDGRRYERGDFPLERALATGEVVRDERIELVTQRGTHVVLDVSAAPILDSAGEALGALSLFQDVTLRERQERAEREFVTNAAHELQSPLAAIVSAIEVLQSGAKDGEQRDVFLGHIERESDRLARLVRALLVLARSQIGVEAPRDELVAVLPLLEDAARTVNVGSSVSLEVECPPDLGVLTNRELVEQAVLNLAENAAKNTTTGRIVLSAQELPQGAVEIAVTDTGPGIPPADRARVFERFARADANGKPGFGLGLAIVRAVADVLDARVELDSTVGVGTIVRVRLPHGASMVTR